MNNPNPPQVLSVTATRIQCRHLEDASTVAGDKMLSFVEVQGYGLLLDTGERGWSWCFKEQAVTVVVDTTSTIAAAAAAAGANGCSLACHSRNRIELAARG